MKKVSRPPFLQQANVSKKSFFLIVLQTMRYPELEKNIPRPPEYHLTAL